MTNILSLTDLSFAFGNNKILEKINLSLKEGHFVSLLGPSGSGKSTLLRIISGLERKHSGHIFFQGDSIQHLPPQKRGIPVVFQEDRLFPHLKVEQNITIALTHSGLSKREKKEKALKVLKEVELQEYAQTLPHELSGGQRQRVALARALVQEPKLILLDEPFSKLDTSLKKRLWLFLRQLHQRLSCTILMVTHDKEEACYLSHRVVVLQEGKLFLESTPAKLYTDVSTLEQAVFLNLKNTYKTCDMRPLLSSSFQSPYLYLPQKALKLKRNGPWKVIAKEFHEDFVTLKLKHKSFDVALEYNDSSWEYLNALSLDVIFREDHIRPLETINA